MANFVSGLDSIAVGVAPRFAGTGGKLTSVKEKRKIPLRPQRPGDCPENRPMQDAVLGNDQQVVRVEHWLGDDCFDRSPAFALAELRSHRKRECTDTSCSRGFGSLRSHAKRATQRYCRFAVSAISYCVPSWLLRVVRHLQPEDTSPTAVLYWALSPYSLPSFSAQSARSMRADE